MSEELARDGHYEVINAGVPGYTSYQEVRFFEEYLAETDPDLVIWTYCLNDNHKFLHRFNEKGRRLWTEEAEKSLEIHTVLDSIVSRSYVLSEIQMGLRASGDRTGEDKGKFVWERNKAFNIAWKNYSWRRYEKHLREMKRIVNSKPTEK